MPASSERHLFGPFVFDERAAELRKHGVPIRIKGQPLQILGLLLRRPGSVVTRDEIQAELWKGTTFVDFEHGLNAAMNRLRQALGDSADQPRYVETVPGRGYRFIAPVEQPEPRSLLVVAPPRSIPGNSPEEPSEQAPPPALPSQRRYWNWAAPAAAVTALIAAAPWFYAGRPSSVAPPPLTFSVAPPAGYAFEAASSRQTLALSPDGSRLVFSAMDSSGRFSLFLRKLNDLQARLIPDSMGSYNVFWSPEGDWLFTTRWGTLRRSDPEGKGFQEICPAPPILLTGAVLGSNVLLSARMAEYLAPVAGGPAQKLSTRYPWPSPLPGGRHLLYAPQDPHTGERSIRVAPFGGDDKPVDLVQTQSRAAYAPSLRSPGTGYLLYVRAGNLLAHPFDPRSRSLIGSPVPVAGRVYTYATTGAADFAVSNTGTLAYVRYISRSQLAWVDRKGTVLTRIGPSNVNLKQGRLSPDGKKVASPIFNVERGVFEIWITDLETGAARKAISHRGLVDNPVWAPDSTRLVFNNALDKTPSLAVRGIGEHDAEEALPEQFFQVPVDWSPDGRFIAFNNTEFASSEKDGQGDIFLVDMARGRKLQPLIQTPHHEANAAFSPDGRWIAFTSTETGRAELYLQQFIAGDQPRVAGERFLVSRTGAQALRWRRDGKELFYAGFDGKIHAVPISLSPKPVIGRPVALFAIGMEARAAVHGYFGFDVSPDGQRLLVPTVTTDEQSEIVIMQNWEAALARSASS